MRNTKRTPPHREYKPNADGIYTEKPVPDFYLTVIRKVYHENGSISADTWYYDYDSLHGFSTDHPGVLQLKKHNVNGRDQISFYPWSEIIRVDYNPPSTEYWNAVDAYLHDQARIHGLSYEEYIELERQGESLVQGKSMKDFLSKALNIPADNIEVIDFGDLEGPDNEH
jgi:hypothetical protein